jgi:hypothetical protein
MKRGQPVFSRPLAVKDLPAGGRDITIEATAQERAEIARQLALPAIDRLVGSYHVSPTKTGARVAGEVVGQVRQICVVSLEPFAARIREPVEVSFAVPTVGANPPPREELVISPEEDDPAEPLLDGKIDLGAVTFEFLALGLDPYPRKEGAEFAYKDASGDPPPSPFAVLADRAPKGSSNK